MTGSPLFDPTDRIALVDIESTIGEIDILLNDAGIQHREPLLEVSREDWDRVIAIDLTSAFLVGREVAKAMITRGRGKIVNIASAHGGGRPPTWADRSSCSARPHPISSTGTCCSSTAA
ncbi:NAD(P)-dependent dehydrogenase (short-subunit alcohol dehydrogenase family) [Microbacterium proteolyticum]|nr:NAD(P)-dependent dehydrogenase (short-subunit alcohol dehydrogenase family) [Microbacterium sp. SORGH_AS_0344]MDQ1168500.1 NAD(P)-dependent dehydrogenase (short-subunit alcohol dehydrogenase family) [Microbacterium proteolyticum]